MVDDIELADAFDKSLQQIDDLDIAKLKRIGLKVYADGKWSVNKVIQRFYRLGAYLVLPDACFARRRRTVPEGLDEQMMADNSNADELPVEQIIAELRAVRLATKAIFDAFNRQILETNCKFYKYEMSVLAMGFNIIGHQIHHFNVIEERYFTLDK